MKGYRNLPFFRAWGEIPKKGMGERSKRTDSMGTVGVNKLGGAPSATVFISYLNFATPSDGLGNNSQWNPGLGGEDPRR
jgi:hypothetical protein